MQSLTIRHSRMQKAIRISAQYCKHRTGCLSRWMLRFKTSRRMVPKILQEEQGSELIEIALVIPLYFALVFGLISFAYVLFAYGNATFAAKTAARYAEVHSTATINPCSTTDIQNIVNPLLWGAPAGGVTITPAWASGNIIGNIVSVTITLTYNTGMPYIGLTGVSMSTTAQGVIVH